MFIVQKIRFLLLCVQTYLIVPCARDVRQLFQASTDFDIVVDGLQIVEAVADILAERLESSARHDDTNTAHAKVVVVIEAKKAEILGISLAGLANKQRLAGVQRAQELLQPVGLDVDVVVGTNEPVELVDVVVVHELDHHPVFLLRRIRVVDTLQWYERQVVHGARLGAREEVHLAGHTFAPRRLDHERSIVQVLLCGHYANENQALVRLDCLMGSSIGLQVSKDTLEVARQRLVGLGSSRHDHVPCSTVVLNGQKLRGEEDAHKKDHYWIVNTAD